MSEHWPETPESAALMLMKLIDDAEKKDGQKRQRSNLSERQRLLGLYAECYAAVCGRFSESLTNTLH
jgi:hypothetical protein